MLLMGILRRNYHLKPPLPTGRHAPVQHGDAMCSNSQQPGQRGDAETQEYATECPGRHQASGRLGRKGWRGTDFRARGIVTTGPAKN